MTYRNVSPCTVVIPANRNPVAHMHLSFALTHMAQMSKPTPCSDKD